MRELYLTQKKEADGRGPGGDADLSVTQIPMAIRPRFAKHRIEILFWGLRELKRVHWKHIDRPRIDVDCAGKILHSSVIFNYRQHSNFHNTVDYMDLLVGRKELRAYPVHFLSVKNCFFTQELPEQKEYLPPVTFKLIDTKSFGRKNVIASHVVTSPRDYVFTPQQTTGRFML
ncbi:otoferlin [Trichonephila clavipes]|nr:otoferlin [Trichonephila clavipes]